MEDFISKLKVQNIQPQYSDSEYQQLKQTEDANNAATRSKLLKDITSLVAGVGPLGVSALMDAALFLPRLVTGDDVSSSEVKAHPLYSRGEQGFKENMNRITAEDRKTMQRTYSDAIAARNEQARRATSQQLQSAQMLDPSSFLKNLRNSR